MLCGKFEIQINTQTIKKLIHITALLIISVQIGNSQSFNKKRSKEVLIPDITVSTTSFRSVRGWKHGVDIGINTRKDFFVGAFSYQSIGPAEKQGESFQGLQFGFPIFKMDRWSIRSNQRIGIYNKKFISILPTLALTYKANNLIATSIGAGVSERFPVFDFKLIFSLKNIL